MRVGLHGGGADRHRRPGEDGRSRAGDHGGRTSAVPPAPRLAVVDAEDSAALDPLVLSTLPLASAVYPSLRPDERRFVFKRADKVILAHAWAFLHSQGVHSELRAGFGRTDQRRRLRRAVEIFDHQLRRWQNGDRWSPRIAWLVPGGLDPEEMLGRLYQGLLESSDYETFTGLHTLLRLPNAPVWTPFVSANSIRLAKSVDLAKRVRLERAFKAGNASLGLPTDLRPWNSHHPLLNTLPTSWLYQFQPTREIGALIERGYLAGLYNVGHFAIFDPAVVRICSAETVKAVLMAVATRLELGLPSRPHDARRPQSMRDSA
jgi:hypothetical protein